MLTKQARLPTAEIAVLARVRVSCHFSMPSLDRWIKRHLGFVAAKPGLCIVAVQPPGQQRQHFTHSLVQSANRHTEYLVFLHMSRERAEMV